MTDKIQQPKYPAYDFKYNLNKRTGVWAITGIHLPTKHSQVKVGRGNRHSLMAQLVKEMELIINELSNAETKKDNHAGRLPEVGPKEVSGNI